MELMKSCAYKPHLRPPASPHPLVPFQLDEPKHQRRLALKTLSNTNSRSITPNSGTALAPDGVLVQIATRVIRIQARQFAQDLLGPFVRHPRNHHLNFHELITPYVTAS